MRRGKSPPTVKKEIAMSVYITKYEENGVPFVALLIGEKLFRQKREVDKADSEVLSSALRFAG